MAADKGNMAEVTEPAVGPPPTAQVVDVWEQGKSRSIFAHYSGPTVIIFITGLVLNAILLLFSQIAVRAVFLSTVCPEGLPGCPQPLGNLSALRDVCDNEADRAVFTPGEFLFEEIPTWSFPIGLGCLNVGQCIRDETIEFAGISSDCASCFALSSICSGAECFNECIGDPLGLACNTCYIENCEVPFELCAGIDFPNHTDDFERRSLTESLERGLQSNSNGDCFDRGAQPLFNVFNLTLGNSVSEGAAGGAVFLALLLVLVSVVWPFTKLLFLTIVFFVPLSTSKKNFVHNVLALFGKWTLVDVFVVHLIVIGIVIQKDLGQDEILIVFSEARLGIYAFALATIFTLMQSQWLAFLDKSMKKEIMKKSEKKVKTKKIKKKDNLAFRSLKGCLGLCAILSLLSSILAFFVSAIAFNLDGRIIEFEGPDEADFTFLELGTGLVDDCSIYDGHEGIAGAFFMSSFYFIFVLILPIITSSLMIFVAMTYTPKKKDNILIALPFVLAQYCSAEVFFMVIVTIASQFEELVSSAVGDDVDAQCGVSPEDKENGIFCVSIIGTMGSSATVLLFSGIFLLLAQLFGYILRVKY